MARRVGGGGERFAFLGSSATLTSCFRSSMLYAVAEQLPSISKSCPPPSRLRCFSPSGCPVAGCERRVEGPPGPTLFLPLQGKVAGNPSGSLALRRGRMGGDKEPTPSDKARFLCLPHPDLADARPPRPPGRGSRSALSASLQPSHLSRNRTPSGGRNSRRPLTVDR